MLYFVHEIGPFHGQMSPEVLLVHGIGSLHGQIIKNSVILVVETFLPERKYPDATIV